MGFDISLDPGYRQALNKADCQANTMVSWVYVPSMNLLVTCALLIFAVCRLGRVMPFKCACFRYKLNISNLSCTLSTVQK